MRIRDISVLVFYLSTSVLASEIHPTTTLSALTSVATLKPANGGQGKTGQRRWPGLSCFYPAHSPEGKFVFVRQLRGPHLST